MFRKEELESWLVALGNAITKPLDMYLIGGCAMSFKGIKDRTKDIDIVMLKRSDLNRLREALPAIGLAIGSKERLADNISNQLFPRHQ